MAPTVPSRALTPKTDAERQLVQLIDGGQVRPEFARELLRERGKTRKAASVVIAGVDREPEKRVSFADAVKLLKGKLDLEAARTDAVKSHGRWGLIDALIQKGARELADAKAKLKKDPTNTELKMFVERLQGSIIKNPEQYGACFDEATVNEADLKLVCRILENPYSSNGTILPPIFDAGAMIPSELFAVLVTEGGVPYYEDTYGFKNLDTLREIDPNDIPNLENLTRDSCVKQMAAFQTAYQKANSLQPTGPRVTFPFDRRDIIPKSFSTIGDMRACKKGDIAFVGPNADMILFRTQMDERLRRIGNNNNNFDTMDNAAYREFLKKALRKRTIAPYMPDVTKVTRYPNYAFENGGTPGFQFNVNDYRVYVYSYIPDDNRGWIRSRISLG